MVSVMHDTCISACDRLTLFLAFLQGDFECARCKRSKRFRHNDVPPASAAERKRKAAASASRARKTHVKLKDSDGDEDSDAHVDVEATTDDSDVQDDSDDCDSDDNAHKQHHRHAISSKGKTSKSKGKGKAAAVDDATLPFGGRLTAEQASISRTKPNNADKAAFQRAHEEAKVG